MKPKVRIEQWKIVSPASQDYRPPECRNYFLNGFVYGYPGYTDGAMLSSGYIKIDYENRTAESVATIYELGEPLESWVQWMKDHDQMEILNLLGI